MRFTLGLAALAALLACAVGSADAQATRTWVSGVGDDVNPCSRTAPCKTFAGAISKTAANGEISVLDPGGFGAVTITKSISIIADGNQGSILGSSTTGIIINAGQNDVVNLRGLTIEGGGNGLNGIRLIGAGELNIQNSLIRGFQASPGAGISVEPSATKTRVFVTNTVIAKNMTGVSVKPSGSGAADVFLDQVQVVGNSGGGISADGANAKVQLSGSTVFANGAGLASANSGQIISFGNNAIASNAQNGAATGKAGLQ